jgi:hypothetical protein
MMMMVLPVPSLNERNDYFIECKSPSLNQKVWKKTPTTVVSFQPICKILGKDRGLAKREFVMGE